MFVVNSYTLAVILCLVTMLCWGSWANTQKLATKEWPFQLFYWDYAIGILLFSLILGLSLGSIGENGRSFICDLKQASGSALLSAFIGGVIFNISNLLLVSAIDIAGMAVAFPVGVGLALVIGVIDNYIKLPSGNPFLIFGGVALVIIAILLNAMAYKKASTEKGTPPAKGIILALLAGITMGFFYGFVAKSMFKEVPIDGLLSPYSAVFIFALGLFISNFLWNTFFMHWPLKGNPVTYSEYFSKGNPKLHIIGILGGVIWCLGMSVNLLAAEKASPAVSYGLGQGATMIAAAWGVFIWKEFKGSPKGTNALITSMFILFIAGLSLIILAKI
jgi:glucose uptake protein